MSISTPPAVDGSALPNLGDAVRATARIRFSIAGRALSSSHRFEGPEQRAEYLAQQVARIAGRPLLLQAVHAAGANAVVRTLSCASPDTVRAATEHEGGAAVAREILRVSHAAAAHSLNSTYRIRALMVSERQYELWSGATWLGVGALDAPFSAHGLRLTVSRAPHGGPTAGDEYEIELLPLHLAIRRAQARLRVVAQPGPGVREGIGEIELSYRDDSMARARAFLRALIVSYVDLTRAEGERGPAVTASFVPALSEKTADLRELSAHLNALIGSGAVRLDRSDVTARPARSKVSEAEIFFPRSAVVPPLSGQPERMTQRTRKNPPTPRTPQRADRELDELLVSERWFARRSLPGRLAANTPQPFDREAVRTAPRPGTTSELGLEKDGELLARLLEEPAKRRRRWAARAALAVVGLIAVRGLFAADGAAAGPATRMATPVAAVEMTTKAKSDPPVPVVIPMEAQELAPIAATPRPAIPRRVQQALPGTPESAPARPARRVRKPGRSAEDRDHGVANEFGPDDFATSDADSNPYYVLPDKTGPIPFNPY